MAVANADSGACQFLGYDLRRDLRQIEEEGGDSFADARLLPNSVNSGAALLENAQDLKG